MSRETHPKAKVYVGGLGDEGKKEEIERAFKNFGPVHDVWVARNPPGFAFVEFEDLRDAEDAIKALDGKTICGMQVRVEMSRHRGGRGRGCGGGGGSYRGGRRDDRYDRYDNRSRSPYRSPPRRRGRSPDQDRWQSRGRRSRSRSPRRF